MADEFKRYARKLQRLGGDALPLAVAEAINQVATFAHVAQAKNLRDRFTLRNQYTERSLRFYKASPKAKIAKINAVTGSVSPYMDVHDRGGERRPKRGSRAPIAGLAARGGNRRGVVKKRYRAGSLGPGQFVGKPRASMALGVYERYGKGKRVRLIRDLSRASIPIRGNRWHRDAVGNYARRDVIEREFIRQAQRALSGLGD